MLYVETTYLCIRLVTCSCDCIVDNKPVNNSMIRHTPNTNFPIDEATYKVAIIFGIELDKSH